MKMLHKSMISYKHFQFHKMFKLKWKEDNLQKYYNFQIEKVSESKFFQRITNLPI